MRLATIVHSDSEIVAIVEDEGVIPLSELIDHYNLPDVWDTDFKSLITHYLKDLIEWYNEDYEPSSDVKPRPFDTIAFAPLYRNPDKIWGIGLNYADHAGDLDESTPDKYPGSFMRPTTTIIGDGDQVILPDLSDGTTGEGELGLIIGKTCKDVDKTNWLDVVAGFTTIIDMTAEDILRHNPRYLTLSKSFDTYFSFGPVMITADEFTTDDIMGLEVATVHNGEDHAKNMVNNMRYPPDYLVSFHSQVMTLLPGDIISTGTPRAKKINHGDVIECKISGFHPLSNPVE